MSACLILCTAAPAPAAVWALTPLTVGVALNAVGLTVAVATAIRATGESRRARATAEDALAQGRRRQAAKVAAWTVAETKRQRQTQETWSECHVRMANLSDLPVTQVTVFVNDLSDMPSVQREVLGPGETWDAPVSHHSLDHDGRDFWVERTTFTDAEGQKWVRGNTGLHHVKEDDHRRGRRQHASRAKGPNCDPYPARPDVENSSHG